MKNVQKNVNEQIRIKLKDTTKCKKNLLMIKTE